MIDQEKLQEIRKASRRSAMVSALGFGIMAASVIYSMITIKQATNEKADKMKEIQELGVEIQAKVDSLNRLDSLSSIAQAQYQELDNLLQDANEKLVDSYVHESWTKVKVQAVDSFRVGNYAAAIELYTRCLDEFKVPKTERLRITQFRGNANYRAGNLKLAAEDLNEVIDALEGNDLSQDQKTIRNDALFTMLLVHLSEDKTDKALEVSKTLLDKDLPTFELINSSVPASFRSNSKFQEYKKQANKLRSSASR